MSDKQCPPTDVEVVKRNVHAAVLCAEGVVVDPHRGTVVARVVVRARCGRPGLSVARTPHTNTLTTAAGRQVAGEPLVQFSVKNHQGVAVVGPMTGRKRGGNDFGKRRATVGGE